MVTEECDHWFDLYDLSLWPMGMDHAVNIWNTLPSSDGLSAEEKLTCQKVSSFDDNNNSLITC